MLWPPPRTAIGRSLLRAKPTAVDHVGGAGTADDERRAPVVGAVPDPARLFVAARRGDDLAADALSQLLHRRLSENPRTG